jgi:hypothetical protein
VHVNSRYVRPIVDPALAPLTRRWLERLINRQAHPANKLVVEYVLPFALVFCSFGALVTGLQAGWVWAVLASAATTFAVRYEIVSGGLRRYRRHYIDSSVLDAECQRQLNAAQVAINAVLRSVVYRTGLLDHAPDDADLRRHEWEIACRLRDITVLRAEHTYSTSAGVPGPQTAAVLNAHLRAITIAQDATVRRIDALQRYAREVNAADTALHDWQTAEQLARRNETYLDLVARSAADEHAVIEITYLTEQAVLTHDAFRATLDQATLAAQALVFTDSDRTCERELC